jgi:hypothetical protein
MHSGAVPARILAARSSIKAMACEYATGLSEIRHSTLLAKVMETGVFLSVIRTFKNYA